MDKENFKIIQNNLESRVAKCQEKMDHILTTEDLTNITIKEFLELQSFCREEQIDMTEILMVDLYHVLGMGNLTVSQRNIFLSLIHKYASYRSDMKCICSMKEISDLPKLPSKSKFKLHKLGNVTLESEPRGPGRALEVLDETEVTIGDYKQAKIEDRNLTAAVETISYKSLIISGNTLTFGVQEAQELVHMLARDSSMDTLLKCCGNKKNYCNILWSWENDSHTQISGIFLSEATRTNLIKRIKELTK